MGTPIFNQQNDDYDYEGRLKDIVKLTADKINSKFPHFNLYSDNEQNRKTFEVFRAYPAAKKAQICADAENYFAIVSSIINSDGPIDNQRSLWAALKMFGMPSFKDDIFSLIEEDDVIEIYRYDNIQVFRNLNFHDICSYELPELFVYSWDQLYYRDQKYTDMILAAAVKVFTGEHKGIYDTKDLEPYNIFEVFSPKKYKLLLKQKYFYPLKTVDGQVIYGIAVSTVKIEDSLSDSPEPEILINNKEM